MSDVRSRKSMAKSTPKPEESKEKITIKFTRELQDVWERAKKTGMSRKKFNSSLYKAANVGGRPRKYLCLPLFDCCWSIFLLLAAIVLVVSYVPQLNFLIQSTLHSHAYPIMRAIRFGFLAVHPYFMLFGVDLTKSCLIANPLTSTMSNCPCIHDPYPIDISSDGKTISHGVVQNFSKVQILRNAIPIEREYGRVTLLEYMQEHGFVSEPCLTLNYSPDSGPASLGKLTEDESWNKHLNSDLPWDFTWQECHDREDLPERKPLYSLLPDLAAHFEDQVHVKQKEIIYSIAKQWGRAISYMPDNVSGIEMLVVLHGRVKIRIQTVHRCFMYCPPHLDRQGYLINEGDIVIYDKRYWSYNAQTWSNTSFTIAAGIEVQD